MDRLYLLKDEFIDADAPSRLFYCRDCMLVAGLLRAFPERAGKIEVIRSDHTRPRVQVVAEVGEANQWLPLLVLDDEGLPEVSAQEFNGRRFINELMPLLNALHVRHGFPEPHP
jgi:hypothetical protein